METAGNCSDQVSGLTAWTFLKRLQVLPVTPVSLQHLTATPQRSKLLAALLVGTAVTMCALLSLGLTYNSCAFGQCFGVISAADIVTTGSSRIGSSGSDTSNRDFLFNPVAMFQNSAPSGMMMWQARGGCHCECNRSSKRNNYRSTRRQGASAGNSTTDDQASGSVADDSAAAAGKAAVVAKAGEGAGGGDRTREGEPAAGAGGGAEVAVAYPSAGEDVDLHKMYQTLSGIARWMRNNNKDHFPALNPLSPSSPLADSSAASGGATAAGGLDEVQLVTASTRSACRATSAPGMQLKGRKFLMLAQTWEQLSQTRLHLIEAMALAKMLNRTLVLTQVW